MIQCAEPEGSCGHCVGTITKAIQARWQSAQVKANLGTKLVTVIGAGNSPDLSGVICDAGYNSVP
ncbi:heavy-metal-associated domain-containing protein [Alsobacter sp. R-9]